MNFVGLVIGTSVYLSKSLILNVNVERQDRIVLPDYWTVLDTPAIALAR